MTTRIVEWQLPYSWGTGIGIDTNKVISVLLREEDNLIHVNDDNELYTDLQLVDWIAPTDNFPVWVTVGKVLASDWWTQNGLLLNWKTTSWDYARWIYWANWEIYFDWGNGTWNQVYYSSEVDDLFTALRAELATVAFTWDYNDLINRPEFLQQQADWNESDNTKPDYIKNKPTIPTVNDATLTIQKNNITQWTFTANSNTNTTINIPVPNVYDSLTSTSTSDALSANQWKVLNEKIQNLEWIGRFLSLWDASTGQPISFPLSTPYNYATWDYYLVETVSSATPPVNYKPSGTQYTGTASTTVETDELEVWDLYIYDGTVWLLQINHGKTVSFANLAWQPSDNAALDSALGSKQDALTLPANPTSWHLVTWWADNETLVDGWAVPTVPTNVSAFTNDAGYITSASLAWNATSSTAWIVKLASDTVQSESAQTVSSTSGRTYWVQFNSSNQMVVNVPWTDTQDVTSVNWNTWAVTVNEVPSGWNNGDVLTNVSWTPTWAAPSGWWADIEYKTQAEYTALLPWAASDGKHYFIYTPNIISVTGVTLDKSSINLTAVWQTEQLTATVSPNDATDKSVNWSSSDQNVATVDNTWLVTCVTPWTCTITVTTTDGGFTATCGVTNPWTPWANTKVYYKIDDNDTNSTIYDHSWNSVDQTWSGNASYTTDATYGRVAVFDGSSYTQASSIVNFGSECTFIALFLRDNTTDQHSIVVECASGSAFPIWIACDTPSKYTGYYAGSWFQTPFKVDSTSSATANQWVMVATTRASDGTAKLYINWVLDSTVTWMNTPNYSSWNNLRIWNWRDNYYYLEWKFKLFIWENRCWTDGEIAALAEEYWFI